MLCNEEICGKSVSLRMVELSDCVQYYLDWLNDEETNRYLETRWERQSIEKIKNFVDSMRKSTHSYLFAIIFRNKHVGNIKLGPIHPIYKFADISYFIGDKNCKNKGVATESVKLLVNFAFKKLNLNRLEAGVFEQNVASQKVLQNNGFIRDAVLRKRVFLKRRENYCEHIGIHC